MSPLPVLNMSHGFIREFGIEWKRKLIGDSTQGVVRRGSQLSGRSVAELAQVDTAMYKGRVRAEAMMRVNRQCSSAALKILALLVSLNSKLLCIVGEVRLMFSELLHLNKALANYLGDIRSAWHTWYSHGYPDMLEIN